MLHLTVLSNGGSCGDGGGGCGSGGGPFRGMKSLLFVCPAHSPVSIPAVLSRLLD